MPCPSPLRPIVPKSVPAPRDAFVTRLARGALAAMALSAAVACDRAGASTDEAEKNDTAKPSNAGAAAFSPGAPADQLRFVHAPPGDVARAVKDEVARNKAEGRQVLVYVGATWCEPCQRFHAAANQGKLDRAFPKLTLLEFDLDQDGARLGSAGYSARLIPLFAVPAPDGRATDQRFEGSVKGDGAVDEITPKLQKLLAAL